MKTAEQTPLNSFEFSSILEKKWKAAQNLFDNQSKIFALGASLALAACGGGGSSSSSERSNLLPPAPQVTANHQFQFQILVGTNLLKPHEALKASLFAADGAWSIPMNSPSEINFPAIDWKETLKALNADKWNVAEDNPTDTSQVDFISSKVGKAPDGDMFYVEGGAYTLIDNNQINAYAAHVVPGFGAIGPRVILLSRTFADGDQRTKQLIDELANPNVAGVAFEFFPDYAMDPRYKFDDGCMYILIHNKKCYFLIGPRDKTNASSSYKADVQDVINRYAPSGIFNNPNMYVVIAKYTGGDSVPFLSRDGNDNNSVQAVVGTLKAYQEINSGSGK